MWYHVILIKDISCAQKCHRCKQNFHQWLYHCVHYLLYEYLPRDRQSTHRWVNKNMVLFYTKVLFFSTFESIYLKYIKSLQSGQKNWLSISNDMWTHDLRSEVWSYLSYILVTYLDYIFFLVCGNCPLTSKKGRCKNIL